MNKWCLIFLLLTAGTLDVEAIRTAQLSNKEGVFIYWIISFWGTDSNGNFHEWREEVKVTEEEGRFQAILVGQNQLVTKIEAGDELALGFLKAIEKEDETVSFRGR